MLKGRQNDCMELVKQGLTSKEIARKLGISFRTVDQHIAAAIENLGVSNRLAAVSRMHELQQEELLQAPPPPFMLSYTNTAPAHLFVSHTDTESDSDALSPNAKVPVYPLFPPLGGSANTMPRDVRLSMIARIAVFSVMLTCFVIVSILGLMELASWTNW